MIAIDLRERHVAGDIICECVGAHPEAVSTSTRATPGKDNYRTDLPQKLVIASNYDERVNGVPVVEMDFATAESRRMTVVGILDDDDGMSNKRFYRDGQLFKLSGEE